MKRVSETWSRLKAPKRSRVERGEPSSTHQSLRVQPNTASRVHEVGEDNVYGVHIIADGEDARVE